mmetsp:Transcript_78687/g.248695  ORF Transcript_78687/g.248695 Transcript_78687/m.248695 type:complete len:134 (-) Transcript_78687:84-485(-)
MAAQNGFPEAVRLLAEQGVDLSPADDEGLTPLALAAARGRWAVVAELEAQGVPVPDEYLSQLQLWRERSGLQAEGHAKVAAPAGGSDAWSSSWGGGWSSGWGGSSGEGAAWGAQGWGGSGGWGSTSSSWGYWR